MSRHGFEFDTSHPRIVVVHYDSLLSDTEFEDTLRKFDHLLETRTLRYALILNVRHTKMSSFSQARRQAEWMRDRAHLIKSKLLGIALVLPSPVVRGVMTVITSIQPMPTAYVVVRTLEDARTWAERQIAEAQTINLTSSARKHTDR